MSNRLTSITFAGALSILGASPALASNGQVNFIEEKIAGLCETVQVYYPSAGSTYTYRISLPYLYAALTPYASSLGGTAGVIQAANTMYLNLVNKFSMAFALRSTVSMNVYSTGTDNFCGGGVGAVYDAYIMPAQ